MASAFGERKPMSLERARFDHSPDFLQFWTVRQLSTLTTLRTDGTPHVVPVGVTYDPVTRLARVICSRGSVKARNVARGAGSAWAAVCQVDGGTWSTLEGVAVLRDDAASVADAEQRYAARFRTPRVNPERVVIEIAIRRTLGLA
jgi:PPOX class probable F420-dependent enzyme